MDRRQFLRAGSSLAAWCALPHEAWAQANAAPGAVSASLILQANGQGIAVPETFTGLSYEESQLAHPDFFSPQNKDLVALYRRLGRNGILRIGGNTSEFTVWTPEGAATPSKNDAAASGPDSGLNIKHNTVVTPESIHNLAGFLDATGWKLLYGLNLGHGTAESAADEGAFVAKTVDSNLLALQIGNEADLYHRNGIRPPDWSYQDFWKQWSDWAQVIRKRIPGVPLAGPDVGNRIDWVEAFAKQAKGEIVLLTSHYYAEGPPTDPRMDIELLLKPRPGLKKNIDLLLQAASTAQVPYRLSEGNSCYHGGKPGVSDAFASALWGADFMLELAQSGVSGVNFHGGGNGYYTPIAGSSETEFVARPLYYGMLLFSYFAGSSLLPVTLDTGGVNMTAYAARDTHGKLQVALINKDLQKAAAVEIDCGLRLAHARILSLTAPSPDSKMGVTFGGAGVASDAAWIPHLHRELPGNNGKLLVNLPSASAAVVLLD